MSDNYARFYLKQIKPLKTSIRQGRFDYTSLTNLPGWDAVIGLQFENLVLRNAREVFSAVGINPADVLHFGPFFQRQTKRTKGCQIDLLIQLRYHNLFLCEIKFSPEKIGMDVAHQMEEKLNRISVPKGWSKRSVLIHVNGVTRDVEQSGRFDHMIDFGTLVS